jgi:hypothetical protein
MAIFLYTSREPPDSLVSTDSIGGRRRVSRCRLESMFHESIDEFAVSSRTRNSSLLVILRLKGQINDLVVCEFSTASQAQPEDLSERTCGMSYVHLG